MEFHNYNSTSSTSYYILPHLTCWLYFLVNCFKYHLGNMEKPKKRKRKRKEKCFELCSLLTFWIGNLAKIAAWLATKSVLSCARYWLAKWKVLPSLLSNMHLNLCFVERCNCVRCECCWYEHGASFWGKRRSTWSTLWWGLYKCSTPYFLRNSRTFLSLWKGIVFPLGTDRQDHREG